MASVLFAGLVGCSNSHAFKMNWFHRDKDAVKESKDVELKDIQPAETKSVSKKTDSSKTNLSKKLVKTDEGYKTVDAKDVQVAKATDKNAPKRTPKPNTCLKAGQCLEQSGDSAEDATVRRQNYDKARQAYEQALSIDPKFQAGIVSLARLHEKEGRFELAVSTYKKGLELYPETAAMWFDLGMCWGRQKQWDSSVTCLKKAAALEPNNAQYANYVGWSLARGGREKESLEHFRRSVGEARAHYNMALMMHHMGNKEKCQEYLQVSLKADPKLADAQVLQAKLESPAPSASPTASSAPAAPEIQQVKGKK